MKTKIFGGLLIAILAVTSAAEAQNRTPVVNHRQYEQQARIREGERHGQLTRAEAYRLQRNEAYLQREKRIAMADGRITPAERRHLQYMQNRLSYNIYNKKHNGVRYY